MKYPYPFTDTPLKREIAEASDHGQATGDWNPLLNNLNTALRDNTLDGPFFFHGAMRFNRKEAYNWCIVELDAASRDWLQQHLVNLGGYKTIQQRYKDFFGVAPHFPNHLPARLLAANEDGNAGAPSTLSWFLDQYLPNIEVKNIDYVCGLEIISCWEARFEAVYNPVKAAWLDKESLDKLTELQAGLPLGALATLAALVHEAGHGLGANACLPQLPNYARKMPMTWYGALGELTTEMAGLALVSDIAPALIAFIFAFRLAGNMSRGGVAEQTGRQRLNTDYDCLTSALMFERFRKAGVLARNGAFWRIDFEAIQPAAAQFLQNLERLGQELTAYADQLKDDLVRPAAFDFIANDLPVDDEQRWAIPPEQQSMLAQVAQIPRSPAWSDMLKYYTHQHLLDVAAWRN
jgi:hypothetical protein